MTYPQTPQEQELRIADVNDGDVQEKLKLSLGENSDGSCSGRGLRVLFLSSDTGGGHRASAESLAKQFQLLYPGTTYDLIDVVASDGVRPYSSLVSYYKHLSNHPTQWKIVYGVSNSRAFELVADVHLRLMCERAIRRRIKSYNPDVVVSVHPLMNNVPVLSCAKISRETGKHLPMFTVVTDLGSAHSMWFNNGVEKMFVGSNQVYELAKSRGKVAEEKLVMAGLPIRHDFAIQSEKMGVRTSEEGRAYQRIIREHLQLPFVDRKTILIMGGGEGNGALSNIVNALYFELVSQGINATLLVVCGRNEELQKSLNERDWNEVIQRWKTARERHGVKSSLISLDYCVSGVSDVGCIDGGSTLRKILSNSSISASFSNSFNRTNAITVPPSPNNNLEEKNFDESGTAASIAEAVPVLDRLAAGNSTKSSNQCEPQCRSPGNVNVIGLGFVTNIAEYMVAADILVTKAGPGTISEAAALSLPIILTSFLPGQEEGNVDFVVKGGFGEFCSDTDPIGMAEEVCMWLLDEQKLQKLSERAKACGMPHAARDIVQQIGDSALEWRKINTDTAAKGGQPVDVSVLGDYTSSSEEEDNGEDSPRSAVDKIIKKELKREAGTNIGGEMRNGICGDVKTPAVLSS